MNTVKALMDRIRWDPEFGRGRFVVGFDDHLAGGIVRVPFAEIKVEQGSRFSFSFLDDGGRERMVPYHRVREVVRDGVLIWRRDP